MSIVASITALFLLLILGSLCKVFGALKKSDSVAVNSIILNLTMPAFVFTALHGEPLTREMAGIPLIFFATTMIAMGLAYLAARALRLDRRTTGGLMIVSAFGNTGFLGYPVTMAAFPGDAKVMSTVVLTDQFGMLVPLLTIGALVAATFASSSLDLMELLKFLRSPLFIATALAVLVCRVPIPNAIMEPLEMLGNATIPLAMISLGLMVSRVPVRSIAVSFTAAFALKMVALPIMTCFALRMFGIEGPVLRAIVLEAGMPTAVLGSIVAAKYGANGAFVSGATFLMTLLSIATIPISLSILG